MSDNEIWGFYEDKYPTYTNKKDAHPELSSLVTPEEVNYMVSLIKKLEKERDEARAEVVRLRGDVLQRVGECLAGLPYAEVSRSARLLIRGAVDATMRGEGEG